MAPLITLLATYAVAMFVSRGRSDRAWAGRLALAVMLAVTGTAHFTRTGDLSAMVPPGLPQPTAIVLATGIVELIAVGLLLIRPVPALGWSLALFFIALLPANVYSAVAEVGLGGNGASYLWFRVPLQGLFIGWALVCCRAVYLPSAGKRRLVISGVWTRAGYP